MKTVLKFIAVFLLLFLGLGGLYGAWMLISEPNGSKFDWTLDLLAETPFRSFLIPGIVLAISNGFLPLFIAITHILKKNIAALLTALQGGITIIWLSAQLFFNPDFFTPATHYPSYLVGTALLLIGLLLLRSQKK